jgi:homoaconitase/3-isopropylmalate dehydratase large subunit
MLHALKERQYLLTVATGKSRWGLDQALAHVALKDLFHASRTADETAGKPHPRMLHELMAETGVPAERTLMVGDTTHDLQLAAMILKGRQVSNKVRLIITPGSQTVYREALRLGIIETLMEAGAVVTPATCGACGGGHMGVLGPNETCITASTRNFKGRMGDPSARIYMASPATVAASAVRGMITDPRHFLG